MPDAVTVPCPHCGEVVLVSVDPGEGSHQRVEDCAVCCAPMVLTVTLDGAGDAEVAARREND